MTHRQWSIRRHSGLVVVTCLVAATTAAAAGAVGAAAGDVAGSDPDGAAAVVARAADGATTSTEASLGSYGEFTPLPPARILDTRNGIGRDGSTAPLGPDQAIDVQVTGQGGVADTEVVAVVMNVTVTRPTERSFLTVWPTGGPRPDVSNLNYVPGQTIPNHVTVAVGAGGKVTVSNRFGTAHVIFDVVGYYADTDGTVGNRYHAVRPFRLFDTRSGLGGVPATPLGTAATLTVDVPSAGWFPKTGTDVAAVVMNVTAARATERSFLTVFPGDLADPPNASSLNYLPGGAVPNLVTVRLPADGTVKFFNRFGSVDLIADVVGYFDDDRSTDAGRFIAFDPYRVFDSRAADPPTPWGPDEIWLVGQFPGFGGIPLGVADSVVLNVTATRATEPSFITIFPPHMCVLPDVSNLNFGVRQTVPNQVIVRLASQNAGSFCGDLPPDELETIAIYNRSGDVHVIIDLFGFYTAPSFVALSSVTP